MWRPEQLPPKSLLIPGYGHLEGHYSTYTMSLAKEKNIRPLIYISMPFQLKYSFSQAVLSFPGNT